MGTHAEVLVIGGGIAGVAAALAARATGRTVVLVRTGPGATALAGGAWVGNVPDPLRAALSGAGYALQPVDQPLAHPTGELYPADLAPPEHAAATIAGGTLVCGIAGLPGFHPRALARLWGDAAGRTVAAAVVDVGAAPAGGWSVPSLAAVLEREPGRIADAVARTVRDTGAERVILPAVLGIDHRDRIRSAIEEAAGVTTAEALGSPPSLPGWRLDRALLTALARAGVSVHTGRVTSPSTENRRVTAVLLAARAAGQPANQPDLALSDAGRDRDLQESTITTDSVVLATGKFLGAGIRLDDHGLREPALGCPVWVERFGQHFTENAEPLTLTSAARHDPQPLLAAGVHTDRQGRAIDDRGDVVFGNVFVAGAVRAGIETASAGLGHMAETGWAAGVAAAEAI